MSNKVLIFFVIACILSAVISSFVHIGIYQIRVIVIYLCLVAIYFAVKKVKAKKE